MNVNEDTDILDRLGILSSKLECPNKRFTNEGHLKDMFSVNATNGPSSSSAICPGSITFDHQFDGWSGLSLDESINSGDDSDCLFDHTEIAVANGSGSTRRLRNHRRTHRHHSKSFTISPNYWKLIALLCAATYLGSLVTLPHSTLFFSQDVKGESFPSKSTSLEYFLFLAVHALSICVGSSFASSTILRLNPFSIFGSLMFVFLFICVQIKSSEVDCVGYSLLLLWCITQSFVAGAIERGLLLVSPLWTIHMHRVLFMAYASMAFGASGSFFLTHRNAMSSLTPSSKLISSWPQFHRPLDNVERNERAISASQQQSELLSNRTTDNPSFLNLNLKNDEHHQSQAYPIVALGLGDVSNGTFALLDNTTISAVSTDIRVNSSSELHHKLPEEELVFKTKTEENAYRRKEIELKRKKEEHEVAQKKQKEQNELVSLFTTIITTTTPTPNTTITETTISTVAFKIAMTMKTIENLSTIKRMKIHLRPSNDSGIMLVSTSVLSSAQLIVFGVLIIPFLLGFCCCCALDHPICSTQYRHMDKLLTFHSDHSDSMLCHLLSMSICMLHSGIVSVIGMTLSDIDNAPPLTYGTVSLPLRSLFWISLGFGRLIIVIRPSLAIKSATLHACYFISICACSLFYFTFLSNMLAMNVGVIISGFFAGNIPLFLYTWHCASTHSSLLIASGRFIIAMAIGKLVGPTAFAWWMGAIGQLFISQSSMFMFEFTVLSFSYAFFLLLLSKLRRSQRQQQITQLSRALNGKAKRAHHQQKRNKKQSKRKTRGPYKALISISTTGADSRDANLSLSALDSTSSVSSSDNESEVIDLEMESIGGEDAEDADVGEKNFVKTNAQKYAPNKDG